jgi:hypothetical protein
MSASTEKAQEKSTTLPIRPGVTEVPVGLYSRHAFHCMLSFLGFTLSLIWLVIFSSVKTEYHSGWILANFIMSMVAVAATGVLVLGWGSRLSGQLHDLKLMLHDVADDDD